MTSLIGIGFFCVIFFSMQRATARRWRILAEAYAGPLDRARETRRLQSVVLLGHGGFNSLHGIVTIGVHKTGISFKLLAPFALFHPPILIPYEDIRGWGTTWYLNSRSSELEFSRVPSVKMIMPAEQAEWIRNGSGNKMVLRDVSPPQGNAGRGWYAFTLVNAGVSLMMIAGLAVYFLSQ